MDVVEWHHGAPRGDVVAGLDRLGRRVEQVYPHIDMDALDPSVAPGVLDRPVPGGLSLMELEEIVSAVVIERLAECLGHPKERATG